MSSNVQTVQRMYQAFGSGNMDAFFECLTSDIVWQSRYTRDVPVGGVFKGFDGIKNFLGLLNTHLDMLDFAPGEFLAGEECVVVLGSERVRTKGTGVEYTNEWVHTFRFRDGKVANFQGSNDAAAAQNAFNPA
jgi:uncharacterized protein